ncbi:MAG TPA: TaqI-like C-terminal specificity domain-containing protein, partial [Paludibacter sp.]
MSLFQIQVERQYLAGITTNLSPIYEKYLAYFGNPAIQANILEVIEEQYQGEFTRALFVDILGYTAQPQLNFNLVREKKNETDSKSADAAILVNNQIVAVIELKDHKTQDLKKVEPQAFGYKNNHKNCHYVVTSNFERLRFYIENAVEFIEFDLFNLTFDEFRRLWICLSYESIAKNLPLEIKQQSISNEDIITKKLYKDYSVFKRLLFDNIVSLNPEYDKLLLFKKTQKLLDRFLFLFFDEDKELLPANSIKRTVEKWAKDNADPMNDYRSLYSRFVRYFKLLDEGYKDTNLEIYAYNGGLFANDELLNQIRIDDAILSENVLKLATYDFGTEVDVNILGHIFENSLNEIEQVANEISTGVKTTSKRKQDGVFYTPRYITQYIVENTVGRLCEEKKAELGIGEDLFEYKRADKRKQALKVFDSYREWLLHITILDPACGSGAFLNMALEFLITEHNWIDRQQEKIAGLKGHYSMKLSNIENTILENNLFGVDINDESVEIAKLSLWLRTAKPHRKLNSLNNNIKCGNSLIDDPAVAGEKAFDWYKEFPQVFGRKGKTDEVIIIEKNETPDYLKLIKEKSLEAQAKAEQGIVLSKEALEITKQLTEYVDKLESVSEPKAKYEKLKGGFDVVIGNPPYVFGGNEGISNEEKKFFKKNYITGNGKVNLFTLFIEKSHKLLKYNGEFSFIIPNTFLRVTSYDNSRRFFIENFQFRELADFGNNVFENAVTTSIVLTATKKEFDRNAVIKIIKDLSGNYIALNIKDIIANNYVITSNSSNTKNELVQKMNSKSVLLGIECEEMIFGVVITKNRDEIVSETFKEGYKPFLEGKDISAYYIKPIHNYLNYKPELLHRPRTPKVFEVAEKLLVQRISGGKRPLKVAYDNNGYYNKESINNIILKSTSLLNSKFLLVLLNSKLINWLYNNQFTNESTLTVNISKEYLSQIPIRIPEKQDIFISLADKMLTLTEEIHEA